MSTDIVDKDLKNLRNARWDRAFKKEEAAEQDDNEEDAVHRKASTSEKADGVFLVNKTRDDLPFFELLFYDSYCD